MSKFLDILAIVIFYGPILLITIGAFIVAFIEFGFLGVLGILAFLGFMALFFWASWRVL